MYVDLCKYKRGNKTYKRVLLREGYREGGKVKHRTLANLSHCSDEEIEAIRIALKMKKNLVELKNLAKGSYWCGKHVGPVAVLYQIANHLGITQALGYSKNALLALWLIMARLIDQGSRLSAVRLAQNHAVAEILNLNAFNEDDLYKTLDWLYEHKEKIENRLFKERGHGSSFYLYDVTSSYLEGKENELADWGYNRDKKKGKKQIVYGLLTDEEGEPISIEGFCGNTKDNKTVRVEIETLKERFGCRHITLVGDKGMIKSGEIEDLKTAGFHYITSITKSQIKTLLIKGVFQLSLFDEDLCEVEDREEGVRYILRRNPFRAEEMHKTRLSKIEAIGEKIEKANRYLYEHKRAKIATQIRHIKEYIVKLKLDGLLDVEADEGKKQLKLNVDKEALCRAEELDGCYALKTDLPREVASKETIHDRYKGLSEVEWAFRTQKTGYLQVRPIYVRKRERSIAHLLIVMLAYKMERYLRSAWEDLDITVKEGISRLAKITSNVIAVGEKRFVTVLGLNRGHTAHFAPPKFGKAELHMSAELLIIC